MLLISFEVKYNEAGSKGGDNGQLIQFYSCDPLRLKTQIFPDKTSICNIATFSGNF